MRRLHKLLLSSATLAALTLSAPGLAHAIEVQCSDENGTCTASNDDYDFITCNCGENGGTVGGGGENEWAVYSEEQLKEVYEGYLELCAPFETDGGETEGTTTGGDPTDSTTGDPTGETEGTTSTGSTTNATGDSGDTSGGSGDTTGTSGTDGTGTDGTDSGDTGTSGSGGETSETGETGGVNTGTGGTGDDGSSTGESGDTEDGSSTDGGETGGDSDKKGCSIDGGAGSAGLLGLGALLLFGRRRRR